MESADAVADQLISAPPTLTIVESIDLLKSFSSNATQHIATTDKELTATVTQHIHLVATVKACEAVIRVLDRLRGASLAPAEQAVLDKLFAPLPPSVVNPTSAPRQPMKPLDGAVPQRIDRAKLAGLHALQHAAKEKEQDEINTAKNAIMDVIDSLVDKAIADGVVKIETTIMGGIIAQPDRVTREIKQHYQNLPYFDISYDRYASKRQDHNHYNLVIHLV